MSFRIFTPLLLAGFLGLSLGAGEATERRLGLEALAARDYPNAAKFFSNARVLAADDPEGWARNTLSLAECKLWEGDVDSAEELLGEFRKRFPARSAGLLPGEILMKRERFAEAEEFYAAYAAGATDPQQACAALLALGAARFRNGKIPDALQAYERLENENADLPEWVRRAHVSRIFTLLEAGLIKPAEELLQAGKYRDADPVRYRQLEMLAALKHENLDEFYTLWQEFPRKEASDKMWQLLSSRGALLAEVRKQPGIAEKLFQESFALADNEADRQNALRGVINLQAARDPLLAAQSLRRYLEFYPEASDRIALQLRIARLLAANEAYKEALTQYEAIAGDRRNPLPSRLVAAREAATAAIRSGETQRAVKMLRYVIEHAETASQRQEGEYLLGEQLYRQKQYKEAAVLFRKAADGGGNYAEGARYWLLHSLLNLEEYALAVPVAELLLSAEDASRRVAGAYFRAYLLEKRGQLAAARSSFERFLVENPTSEFAPAAMLQAAELALALQDFPAAADGFFRYVDLEPVPPDAERALYLAMQAGAFGSRDDDVERALKLFDERYPDSPGNIEARLQLADYLLSAGKVERGEALLDEVEKRPAARNSPEIAAELLFRRGMIALGRKDSEKAKQLFDALLKEYPASTFAPDAAFRAGDIESDAGRYKAALALYERAKTLSPEGLFGKITDGRIADCLYSLYAETLNEADLTAATERYTRLAADETAPLLRLQSLYKLGKCRELADRNELALECYNRVLYLAVDMKRRGIAPEPVWCGKAAHAAVRRYLDEGTPAGAREALRVLGMLDELRLPVDGEFERIRQEILQKYNLR